MMGRSIYFLVSHPSLSQYYISHTDPYLSADTNQPIADISSMTFDPALGDFLLSLGCNDIRIVTETEYPSLRDVFCQQIPGPENASTACPGTRSVAG
jgi:hypothetical protein